MATMTYVPPDGSIEQRLAKLESLIKIGSDGSLTIECNGRIRIKAAASVEIEGATTVVVKGAAKVDVAAGTALTLKAAGQASLQGSLVKLNGGSKPLARTGDMVALPVGPPGTVQGGNPTVLA
jgi:hypothetical protein